MPFLALNKIDTQHNQSGQHHFFCVSATFWRLTPNIWCQIVDHLAWETEIIQDCDRISESTINLFAEDLNNKSPEKIVETLGIV